MLRSDSDTPASNTYVTGDDVGAGAGVAGGAGAGATGGAGEVATGVIAVGEGDAGEEPAQPENTTATTSHDRIRITASALSMKTARLSPTSRVTFETYLQQLDTRHLANLRFAEVTRALRALSSAYVERRESALADRKALDGAGKRAAFALYYGPLHFLLIQHIVRQLGVEPAPGVVVDLGCGTGVAGAAIAEHLRGIRQDDRSDLRVLGIDTHPWALDEARFTYKAFGLRHDVRRGHAGSTRFPGDTSIVVAAFVVNELNDKDRAALLEHFTLQNQIGSREPGTGKRHRVLVVEPISQRISPWWDQWAAEFARMGGRSDVWKARVEMPPIVKRLAKASGLRPEMLTARSLFV
jgi:ubiquinone/menaquinone biosynthesis C-methylase UbiE